jgi:Ca-activated chloride channel family protein
MSLLWPGFLLLLGLIPLLIALYAWLLRRRRRYAVRYSSLSLVREALAGQSRWRRHVPFALFLLALACLALALTRPITVVQVPTNETAIILAMDVSGSMCSTDIPPNRLAAAQAAALGFIERQPAGTRIGIVAFAGFAQLIQPPTTDRAALDAAINGLNVGRGTAIGRGIVEGLAAIAEVNDTVAPPVREGEVVAGTGLAPAAGFAPEIIVVLTDGVTTTGMDPVLAAQQAAERGVRVYTIGFGTANGSGSSCGRQFGGSGFGGGFGGGGFGGGGFRRGIDEAALEQIAEITDGAYYAASSAGELQSVFADLPLTFSTRGEVMEISVAFAAIGAVAAAAAVALSLGRGGIF